MRIMHTTNYYDTFIEVAEDSSVTKAQVPPTKEPKTAAAIQYEMLANNPYVYTSDDVLYASNGERRGLTKEEFFSKGQPCFRSSPLTKRYGWGEHSDSNGKIAICPIEAEAYKMFASDTTINHLKGMRSKRA